MDQQVRRENNTSFSGQKFYPLDPREDEILIEERAKIKSIDDVILRYELSDLLDTHDYNDLELVGQYDFSFRNDGRG